MTSYTLINKKTLTDVLSSLIKFGFGSYNELMNMGMNQLLTFYDWFSKDYEKEMKNKTDYDMALLKAGCPMFRRKK